MAERKWRPGDGAEQTDSSMEAAQERISTDFWTAENRSEEGELGFDAVYKTWRETNGTQHDEMYRRWHRETGESFSPRFLDWVERQSAQSHKV